MRFGTPITTHLESANRESSDQGGALAFLYFPLGCAVGLGLADCRSHTLIALSRLVNDGVTNGVGLS